MTSPAAPVRVLVACLLAGGLAGAGLAAADDVAPTAQASPGVFEAGTTTAADPTWLRDGVARFGLMWDDARSRLSDGTPDWLHRLSRRAPNASLPAARAAYVVVRDDRADGMGQVTVRYPLVDQGGLRAYAGAGLNHTQYFVDGADAGPSLLSRHERPGVVDPAAELGAEIALNGQMRLSAELRWVDLDPRADLLSGFYGPLAPDPVTVGLSLGYRFR